MNHYHVKVYSTNPIFGIKYSIEDKTVPLPDAKLNKTDDVEILDDQDHFDALAAYCADGDKNVDREPVFSAEIGLAVENLRDGVTLQDLWNC